jgi:ribosomal protein L7/L12
MQHPAQDEATLPAAAIVALNRGQVIEAIKLVRGSEPGLGLAGAKAKVDAYVARDPMLKAQVEQQVKASRSRLVRWVIIFDILLFAGLAWYFFLR